MSDPDWYGFADDEDGTPFLTEEAPAEAKESFERFLEQKKSMNKDKASWKGCFFYAQNPTRIQQESNKNLTRKDEWHEGKTI